MAARKDGQLQGHREHYGTVAQRVESLHRRTQRPPVRVRPVPSHQFERMIIVTKEQVIAELERELARAEEKRKHFSEGNDPGSFALEMHYDGRADGLHLALRYIKDMEDGGK